jgi:hypothetical protein
MKTLKYLLVALLLGASASAENVPMARADGTNITNAAGWRTELDVPTTGDLGNKFTNSMSANKLLGRATAGTGAIEEITLGTNLSLSGTTLDAAGGGLARNAELKRQQGHIPNAKMWRISGLADSAAGQARNIRTIAIGNSYRTYPSNQLGAVFGLPHHGGTTHGMQEIPVSTGSYTSTAGGANTGPGGAEGQTIVPQENSYWNLPSGGSITCDMTGTHAWVAYVKESGAGTLTIEEKTDATGAAYATLTTINCNAATSYENYMATPGARLKRSIRITASGGAVKVAYAAVLGQSCNINIGTGGATEPDQWNTTKLNAGTIESWYAAYDPHIVFISYSNSQALHADFNTMLSRLLTSCPNAQIIITGEHAADTRLSPPSIGTDSWDRWSDVGLYNDRNESLQEWCVDHPRVSFVDVGKWLPSLNDTDSNGIPDSADVGSISPNDYLHLNETTGEVTIGSGNASVQYNGVYSGTRLGTDIRVRAINPGTPSAALSVTASGNDVTISLATNGSSVATSTGDQVRDAVNSALGATILAAARGDNGGGSVSNGTGTYVAHDYVRLLGAGNRIKNIAVWEAMRPWIFSRGEFTQVQPNARDIFSTAGRTYTQVLNADISVTSSTSLLGSGLFAFNFNSGISKSGLYVIDGWLIVESTQAGGFDCTFDGWNPNNVTPVASYIATRGTTLTAGTINTWNGNDAGYTVPSATWDTVASTVYIRLAGHFSCNGPANGAFDGGISFHFAQNVSNATPTKLKAGSWISVTLPNMGNTGTTHRDRIPGF